jgi:hypothetical protein
METGNACTQCYQFGYGGDKSASRESKVAEISPLLT